MKVEVFNKVGQAFLPAHWQSLCRSIRSSWGRAWTDGTSRAGWLSVGAMMLAVNAIVAVNAARHDFRIQYDGRHHQTCIRCYANGRFPERAETREFFSPPLPYLVPALVCRGGRWSIGHGIKAGQAVNVVLSVGACLCVILAMRGAGGSLRSAAVALLLMGMVPSYYRTMAYVRGEAMIPFFGTLSALLAVRVFHGRRTGWGSAVCLGLAMGAVALSRQWGVTILFALGVFALLCMVRAGGFRMRMLLAGCISLTVGILACGWFYLHLMRDSGSITAFNQEPGARVSISNRPAGFFTKVGSAKLFTEPVRGSFDHRFFPVLHADTWGDYWGYFLMKGWDIRNGNHFHGAGVQRLKGRETPDWLATNYERMGRYLGRVNRLALFPTAFVLLASFWASWRGSLYAVGRSHGTSDAWMLLSVMAVVFSIAFFVWYLIMYHVGDASSVKATYLLQIVPFLAIMGGALTERLALRSPFLYRCILAVFLFIWIHNLPAFFTRFTTGHLTPDETAIEEGSKGWGRPSGLFLCRSGRPED